MYVEIEYRKKVNLMGMTLEEAAGLQRMIEGASLEERRMFNGVLHALLPIIDCRGEVKV